MKSEMVLSSIYWG